MDRVHVLATPGLDGHAAYVALSRHRDGMELHYGRDDFAIPDRLVAPCRAIVPRIWPRIMSNAIRRKAMPNGVASPSVSASLRSCARSCRKRCATCSTGFALLQMCPAWMAAEAGAGNAGKGQERYGRRARNPIAGREVAKPGKGNAPFPHSDARAPHPRRGCDLRYAGAGLRCKSRAGEGIPEGPQGLRGGAALWLARSEAAYKKDPILTREAAGGRLNRAIRALQLETELRINPGRRVDRFVDDWRKLDQASLRRYQAGDISGYRSARSAMGDMARSLERDPQLESLLANRKRALGIAFESGRRLGHELAFSHGIDLGRGRSREIEI